MSQLGIAITSSANASPVFSDLVIDQVVGADDQAFITFKLSGAQTGTVYVRFIDTYDGGGKSEVESEFGFPIQVSVAGNQSEDYFVTSAADLIVATDYKAVMYWEDDDEVTQVPIGNGLEEVGPITITGTIPDPTDILPNTLSVTTASSGGTLIGNLSTDVQGATFTQGTPSLTWVTLASNGQVTIAAGQAAPVEGDYTLKAEATTGGPTYSEDITITVNPISSGGGGSGIPIPASDGVDAANGGVAYTSIANLQSALSSLNSGWNAQMNSWGLATTGVEPVLTLAAAASKGALNLSGLDFSANEKVIIRGEGPYSHDGWVPTAGTEVGRLTASGCSNIWVMGLQAEVSSGAQVDINNCDDVYFIRCSINGDPARSVAQATSNSATNELVVIRGGSADTGLKECSLIGGVARQIGDNGSVTDRIHIDGCVFDQAGGDTMNLANGTNNSWEVHRNLTGGRSRQPNTTHQNFIQVRADSGQTGTAKFWNCTGNCHISGDSFGFDGNASYEVYFWGAGAASSEGFFSDNFMVTAGTGAVKGAQGNSTATFNTSIMMTDVPNSQGASYQASQGRIASPNVDNNIVTKKNLGDDNGEGPNGLSIHVPNGGNIDDVGVDWGPQNAYTTAPCTRPSTMGDFRPVTGTRMHWDDPNPTGSYKMLERMYDDVNHDHWKDRGWPGAALCHIAFDPLNELGGTSGNYDTFDADGD